MKKFLSLKRPGYSRKYSVNSNVFIEENDISYYLLGAYMTDGCINGLRTELTSNDEDWLIAIRNLICPNKPVIKRKISNAFDLKINDINVANWLIDYGCTQNKSLSLKLDRHIPTKYIPDFIRGLIDGDGSISMFKDNRNKTNISVYLCSASEQIINQISEMIPNNIIYHKYKRNPAFKKKYIRGNVVQEKAAQYKLQFNNSAAQLFLKWIYYPEHKLSMTRKYNLSIKAINYKL